MSVAKTIAKRLALGLGYEVVKRGTLANLTPAHHVAEVLERTRINCVVDVGANVGGYGTFLRAIGYEGRIVSFEPVQDAFARLERLCAADATWSARHLALGSTDDVGSINVMSNRLFSSFRAPSDVGLMLVPEDEQIVGREEVEVRRLDSVFEECVAGIDDPRVLLKSHAQGWDLEVLKGASGCLDRVQALQTLVALRHIYEGMPGHVEALAFLDGLGFSVTAMFPVTRDEGFRVIEFDCVLVRADAASVRDSAMAP